MFTTLLEIFSPLLKALANEIVARKKRSSVLDSPDVKQFRQVLSGRLTYLLRYMDANPDPVYPESYGRVLSSFVDVGSRHQKALYEVEAEEAWEKAAKYACLYLSSFGLVEVCGGIGGEVVISDFGKQLVRTDAIRGFFPSAFKQKLH
jgi:hypothetical protein